MHSMGWPPAWPVGQVLAIERDLSDLLAYTVISS